MFESGGWRRELELIHQNLLREATRSYQRPPSEQHLPRSILIRLLYDRIGLFLVNPDYTIFPGYNPQEKLSYFGKFMATCHILKVSGLSFTELENPVFSKLTNSLELPMALDEFKGCLQRLDQTSCPEFLKKVEKVFTQTNVPLFYHPNMPLALDDDKIPKRDEKFLELQIKKKGGRTSRVFPT